MSALVEPHVHLWTRAEYNQMAAFSFFRDKRVELIEGQVVVMSPMGSLHATAVALAAKTVEHIFGAGYFARWQMPFAIGDLSEPEPDVAVIAGNIRDYRTEHPTTAALIIEVADTSLAYDRETKGSLYARASIADYWIINLINRQVEVYRKPMFDDTAEYGFRYAHQIIFNSMESVTPLELPQASILVADLLP